MAMASVRIQRVSQNDVFRLLHAKYVTLYSEYTAGACHTPDVHCPLAG